MNIIKQTFTWYFRREALPYWSIAIIDTLIFVFSAIIVMAISPDANSFLEKHVHVIFTLVAISLINILCFRLFKTYSSTLRYSSFDDLKRLMYALSLSFILVLAISYLISGTQLSHYFFFFHTAILISIYLLSLFLMSASRVWVKMVFENLFESNNALPTFIYGTLEGAVGIANHIKSSKPSQFALKGFLTDDAKKNNALLLGCRVYPINDELPELLKTKKIKAVLVSPLRIDDFRDNERLQNVFIKNNIKIFIVSDAKEWNNKNTDGDKQTLLKEVSIEDLLPRGEIQVDMDSIGKMLKGQKILVTGSAGSIGSEIVRQIANFNPKELILIDQAETPQHDIRLMMSVHYPDIKAQTIVTSICRKDRMEEIFKKHTPDYVFHAAAYKHVPMMENNPSESVLNNIEGTKVIADFSVKYKVKKFVMISTDKAVNPTNVMGCSKRICEIYIQSLHKAITEGKIVGETQFVTTRFGNVLGSNGSVIPLFRRQLQSGGPLTVTHPDIIRYFMLISEACKLVLEAGTKGKGGEIFVFDMGKPVKIATLAQRMIDLSGAKNVNIIYTGLRAGEKLYEEVLNEQETTKPSFHEKIRIATVREYEYEKASAEIDALIDISHKYDDMNTVKQMKAIVPEYKSKNSVYEQLDVD